MDPTKKLPRKAKKALKRLRCPSGPTRRQHARAAALLRKGLRITTGHVRWSTVEDDNVHIMISEHFRPDLPPIQQTLDELIAELCSYGYSYDGGFDSPLNWADEYVLYLPLVAKCDHCGHFIPYKQISAQCNRCPECDTLLFEWLATGTVQHFQRVMLWQGQEYPHDFEDALPVPSILVILYDHFGVERPRHPIPTRGRRYRRYLRWVERQNAIYRRIADREFAEWHDQSMMDWLDRQYEELMERHSELQPVVVTDHPPR